MFRAMQMKDNTILALEYELKKQQYATDYNEKELMELRYQFHSKKQQTRNILIKINYEKVLLENRAKALQSKVDELKSDNLVKSKAINKLNENKEKNKVLLEELNNQALDNKKNSDQFQLTLKDFIIEDNKRIDKIRLLKKRLMSKNKAINKLNSKNKCLLKQKQKRSKKIIKINYELRKSNRHRENESKTSQKIKESTDMIVAKDQEINNLKATITRLNNENREQKDKLDSLTSELANLRESSIAEIDSLRLTTNSLTMMSKSKREENKELYKQIKSQEKMLKNLSSEMINIEEEYKRKESHLNQQLLDLTDSFVAINKEKLSIQQLCNNQEIQIKNLMSHDHELQNACKIYENQMANKIQNVLAQNKELLIAREKDEKDFKFISDFLSQRSHKIDSDCDVSFIKSTSNCHFNK